MSTWFRFTLVVISISFVGVLGTAAEAGTDAEWVSSCQAYPELCVPQCQRDAVKCAKKLHGFVTHQDASETYEFATWQLYPGDTAVHRNVATPMHGAFLTIYANDIAYKYVNDMDNAGSFPAYVDFPNGSIIVKQNFVSEDKDPDQKYPWLTVMMKIDGYCHPQFGGTGNCSGGDWFYYLNRYDSFVPYDKDHKYGLPAVVGKPQAFCTDCHGPVQRADWIYSMFDRQAEFLPNEIIDPVGANPPGVVFAGQCDSDPFSPIVPADVAVDPTSLSGDKAQRMFDCLSWRTFYALNLPADGARGEPASGEITDTGQRVWETYRQVFEIFQPTDPDWPGDYSWEDAEHFAPVCEQKPGDLVLRMSAKNRATPILNETHEAMGNLFNTLTDQNNNLTLFDVLINGDEFNFITENGYNQTGSYDVLGPNSQFDWHTVPIQFPDYLDGESHEGAIEVKAAWREMCATEGCAKRDDPNRYYTRDATYYERNAVTGETSCKPVNVGLVGLHIIHKTKWAPQWAWSTFEHIDNVPPATSSSTPAATEAALTPYSFYSAAAAANDPGPDACKLNRPGIGAPKGDPALSCPNLQMIGNVLKESDFLPNQLIRLDAISDTPLNKLFQDKLAGTPFEYYQLVNTQWPLGGRGGANNEVIYTKVCTKEITTDCYELRPLIPGSRSPLALRNTSMESFQVRYSPNTTHPSGQISSAGCMQCHGYTGVDNSFIWTDAVEAVVPLATPNLAKPPTGTYTLTCDAIEMDGTNLTANCRTFNQSSNPTSLLNAHNCTGDIANINGKLMCNPPTGSFTLTCTKVDVLEDTLSASCLRRDGSTKAASLDIAGYHGVIANCDGVLIKGRCQQL